MTTQDGAEDLQEEQTPDEEAALKARHAAREAQLRTRFPQLDDAAFRRMAREQMLHYAQVNGLYDDVKAVFPGIKPVDHQLNAIETQQVLAVFEENDNALYDAAFLLAVLVGDKSSVDAGREYLELGTLRPQLYQGPFAPFTADADV